MFRCIIFCFSKDTFQYFLTDPYLFIFYLGLFGLFIFVPFEIIYHFLFEIKVEIFGKGVISQIGLNSNEYIKNFFYSFLLIITYLITFGSQILIIYYLTPCHLIIFLMLYGFVYVITHWNNDINFFKVAGFVITSIIMIFSTWIYNEIIIIKLCSMEKYTAKYILLREKIEYESLNQFYDNDDENEELSNCVESLNSIIENENFSDK